MYILRTEFQCLRGLLTVVAKLFLMVEPYVAESPQTLLMLVWKKSPAGNERHSSKWMTPSKLSLYSLGMITYQKLLQHGLHSGQETSVPS